MKNDKILFKKKLAVFFTFRISLNRWYTNGMIDREIALYNELSENFEQIYLFTYGNNDDLNLSDYLSDNITVIPKKHISNDLIYSIFLPLIHYKTLKNIDIIKTNQMGGSWAAVLTKLFYGNKLVVRTGYMLSKFTTGIKKKLAIIVERLSYHFADGIIANSDHDLEYLLSNYHPSVPYTLIPNFIETEIFKPLNLNKKRNSICFVGRLSKQKNLFELLKSLKNTPYYLTIVGAGELEEPLKEYAKINKINAKFLGNKPNHELPNIINQHEIFILPSLYEGMPKTLIEAMSCQMPVIGADVEGISEIIEDGYNGLLCKTNSESIHHSIETIMNNKDLQKKLAGNARKTVLEKFSFEIIAKKEKRFYKEIL